ALKDNQELQGEVLDAMMPKDTGFFRDWKPFEHFRNTVLPNAVNARRAKRTFRVLSAGSSTGQEAYSAAIAIRENEEFKGWNVEVVGIDLSRTAIDAADRASYSQFDIQRGLPVKTLMRHFTKQNGAWTLGDNIRAIAHFK